MLAHVLERVGELVADLVAHDPRDADAARFRQCLQPRCDVDAVAVDVVAIDNHITKIDPDANGYALVLGHLGIAVDHRPLDLGSAADRIDDAREFDQHAVAGRPDDAAAVLLDLGIDQFAAMGLEPFERPFLVNPIGRE